MDRYSLCSNPNNPTSLYFRGVSHAKNKNHNAAIRGISYFYIGEFQKAYDDLTICFRLSSQNPMAYFYLGLCCYELGKYDEGLDHLYKARDMGYDVNPIVVNRFLDKKMKVVDN